VNSRTTERFRRSFDQLPEHIQHRARLAYDVFRDDPYHPSLQFKKVHATRPIFSVRVGLAYRALGIREGDAMIWFWIGSHADYDQLVSRLQRD
jgi:hypothetical protein